MLIPDTSCIELRLSDSSRGAQARVSVDGRDGDLSVGKMGRVVVRKSPFSVPCVQRSKPASLPVSPPSTSPSISAGSSAGFIDDYDATAVGSWYQDINAILKWNQSFRLKE